MDSVSHKLARTIIYPNHIRFFPKNKVKIPDIFIGDKF